jgi:[protein-PII] uridylyltransferase
LVPARSDVSAGTLRGLLYPLWDAGFQVGHALRTAKEAVERATQDLDAATSLLSARLVSGSDTAFEELHDRLARWVAKDKARLARRILESRAERHRRSQRAGWALAPDLKDDVGGLRDAHVVFWLERIADKEVASTRLKDAAGVLIAAREALHAELKRKSDRLRLDLQPAVARRVGLEGDDAANELMMQVHSAARAIEHHSALHVEELSEELLGGPKRSGAAQTVAPGIRVEDGALAADALEDAATGVRLLGAKAHSGKPIARKTLDRLDEVWAGPPLDRWPSDLREAFLHMLRGAHVSETLEILDHVGAWAVLLPEWNKIRGLAQHDPYHRYTVDGHSFIAVGEVDRAIANDQFARSAADEAGELDALYLAALFHDIGKGSGEDHSVAGERLARNACTRMGLDPDASDDVCSLVRYHLLLVDTATRRDLDDGAVIAAVAEQIATPRRLRLLYVLSIADGRATGPEGWSDWKAILVRELYLKAMTALETGELPVRTDVAVRAQEVEAYEPTLAGRAREILSTLPPSYLEATPVPDMVDDIRMLLQTPKPGEIRVRIDAGVEADQSSLTLCVTDRPGTLARTAGVLSLHRLSVLRAQAYSVTSGIALERFLVRCPEGTDWDAVKGDLEAAYSGRLAVEARLEKKASDYKPRRPIEPDVRILQDASAHSTVVEVRATDALGLLYAITAALSDLDIDIHVAKIDTLGERVVDVFYVRSAWGAKLDEAQAEELPRSIAHRVARLLGA